MLLTMLDTKMHKTYQLIKFNFAAFLCHVIFIGFV